MPMQNVHHLWIFYFILCKHIAHFIQTFVITTLRFDSVVYVMWCVCVLLLCVCVTNFKCNAIWCKSYKICSEICENSTSHLQFRMDENPFDKIIENCWPNSSNVLRKKRVPRMKNGTPIERGKKKSCFWCESDKTNSKSHILIKYIKLLNVPEKNANRMKSFVSVNVSPEGKAKRCSRFIKRRKFFSLLFFYSEKHSNHLVWLWNVLINMEDSYWDLSQKWILPSTNSCISCL